MSWKEDSATSPDPGLCHRVTSGHYVSEIRRDANTVVRVVVTRQVANWFVATYLVLVGKWRAPENKRSTQRVNLLHIITHALGPIAFDK